MLFFKYVNYQIPQIAKLEFGVPLHVLAASNSQNESGGSDKSVFAGKILKNR